MSNYAFQASAGTTTGNTVLVTGNNTPTSVAGSINCKSILATTILVTNLGTVLAFIRMSPEATPTATAADIPIPAGTARVFSNPVPNSILGLAVLSSTTTNAPIYFTPGTGGI